MCGIQSLCGLSSNAYLRVLVACNMQHGPHWKHREQSFSPQSSLKASVACIVAPSWTVLFTKAIIDLPFSLFLPL